MDGNLDSWNISFQNQNITAIDMLHSDTGTEVAVVLTNDAINVVFRGTDSDSDWNINFDYDQEEYRFGLNGKVHSGFQNATFNDDILGFVENTIEEATEAFPNKALRFLGHSKGAAEATLLASYFATLDPGNRIQVFNYGGPRVGNLDFKNSLREIENLTIWHVVNDKDIVARLPPKEWGFLHVGHLLFLRDGGVKAYYQHLGKDAKYEGIDSTEWGSSIFSTKAYNDHVPIQYENAISLAENNWTTTFEPSDGRRDTCCFEFIWCWSWCKE